MYRLDRSKRELELAENPMKNFLATILISLAIATGSVLAEPKNIKPEYPRLSQRYGEQGTVILRVLVTSEGTVGTIEVKKSSGYSRLDNSALEAVKTWKFNPATQNGVPVDEWITLPYTFRLIEETGAVPDPKNIKPTYPISSRRYGEQGTVILRFLVTSEGTVGTIEVKKSTGYPRLDDAALEAVKTWKFNPATREGVPVEYWYESQYTFRLNEENQPSSQPIQKP